jgi:hypothetical protein
MIAMDNREENITNQDLPKKKKVRPLYIFLGMVLFFSLAFNIFALYFYLNIYSEVNLKLVDTEKRLLASKEHNELLFNNLPKATTIPGSFWSPDISPNPSSIPSPSPSPKLVSFSEDLKDIVFASDIDVRINENVDKNVLISFNNSRTTPIFEKDRHNIKVYLTNDSAGQLSYTDAEYYYKYDGVWKRLNKSAPCGFELNQMLLNNFVKAFERKEISSWNGKLDYCIDGEDVKISMPIGEYKVRTSYNYGQGSSNMVTVSNNFKLIPEQLEYPQ